MSLLLVTATSGSPGFQIISGDSTNIVLSSHVITDGLMLIFQDLSHLGSSSNPWSSSNSSITNDGGSTRHSTRSRSRSSSECSSDGSTTNNDGSTRHSNGSRSNSECISDGSTANKSTFITSQMVLLVRK